MFAYGYSGVFARGWLEIAHWALSWLPVLMLGPGQMLSASRLATQKNYPLWVVAGCLAFFTPLVFGMVPKQTHTRLILALGFVQTCAGPCPATAGRVIAVVVVGLLMASLCVVFWHSPLKALVYGLSEAGFVAYVLSLLFAPMVPIIFMALAGLISTG